jgi:phosphoglycerate dehydrogenase-like enzyme
VRPVPVTVAASVETSLLERLREDPRVALTAVDASDEESLIAAIAEAHVVVTRAYNPMSARVIDAAPSLALIIQGTSGTDNIDEQAAGSRGIRVENLPGLNANAVAEYVIGCMISLTRGIPEYTAALRAGGWPRSDCARKRELRSHTLGIVGLGRVGRRVAELARPFGIRCIGYDPYIDDIAFSAHGVERIFSLDALLHRSHVVTMHVPLTEETRGMLDADAIGRMQPEAIVINASRGAVADAGALVEALLDGRLGGLVLDVFDTEPPATRWPDDPRLIVTPHIAGCSGDSKEAIALRIYEIIDEYLSSPEMAIPSR